MSSLVNIFEHWSSSSVIGNCLSCIVYCMYQTCRFTKVHVWNQLLVFTAIGQLFINCQVVVEWTIDCARVDTAFPKTITLLWERFLLCINKAFHPFIIKLSKILFLLILKLNLDVVSISWNILHCMLLTLTCNHEYWSLYCRYIHLVSEE